jgi:A/G-specific adenine glycosylase
MHFKKFSTLLLKWHLHENKRQMPWKGERDPYKVWLSEIILQQTRVEQGWNYYEKFIQKYPTLTALAKAKDEDVFKLWEGLGYYTRCKNLLFTARWIENNYHGKFPETYEEIILLKGVGSYTAAAISSFCFDKPHAVVDGNVFRVLSRVFGINTPVDSNQGKKIFSELAQKVLDKKNPGLFNQAIMDFGATVCKPSVPDCSQCRLKSICIAFKTGRVNELPVKEKTLQKQTRWFSYFVINANGKTFIHKRTSKDIWQNLYEFYLVETDVNPHWAKESISDFFKKQFGGTEFQIKNIAIATPQQLTHRYIKGYFIFLYLKKIPQALRGKEKIWANEEEIASLPFPAFINQNLIKNKSRSFLAV